MDLISREGDASRRDQPTCSHTRISFTSMTFTLQRARPFCVSSQTLRQVRRVELIAPTGSLRITLSREFSRQQSTVPDLNDISGFATAKTDHMNTTSYKHSIYPIGRACTNSKESNTVNRSMGVKSVHVLGLCSVGKVNHRHPKPEY